PRARGHRARSREDVQDRGDGRRPGPRYRDRSVAADRRDRRRGRGARVDALRVAAVTAPARLLALRLHGFKSFAERTVVEFGPGISAVVGPNGSGKSNLADALRWALGEQGRSLRNRKSEDAIIAGYELLAAIEKADVP